MKSIIKCAAILTLICNTSGLPVNAQQVITQNLRYRYHDAHAPNVVEVDRVVQPTIPRVVERSVILQRTTPAQPDLTMSAAVARSNYKKRLEHLSDQLSMAREKGWLDSAQYEDLRNWHNTVAREEEIFRNAGGGIIKLSDVDTMEKHMTALAFAINKRIEAGSRVAGTELRSF